MIYQKLLSFYKYYPLETVYCKMVISFKLQFVIIFAIITLVFQLELQFAIDFYFSNCEMRKFSCSGRKMF